MSRPTSRLSVARAVVLAAFVGAVAGGCAAQPSGPTQPPDAAVATWVLADATAVDADTTELDVLVTRLECSGGVTGEVLEPVVEYEMDRILIRTDVAPLTGDAYDCQGNDAVPLVVELSEPVGERQLVDAACSSEQAASTAFCEDAGVRWPAASEG